MLQNAQRERQEGRCNIFKKECYRECYIECYTPKGKNSFIYIYIYKGKSPKKANCNICNIFYP